VPVYGVLFGDRTLSEVGNCIKRIAVPLSRLGVDGQGWDSRVGTTFLDTKKILLMLKPVTP
jgi:hypothetical protein